MQKALEEGIWRQADGRCEYCHLPQGIHRVPFQIDHIIAEQHGGPTASNNLAIACLRCNKRKGPNLSGVSSDTGAIVRLFHPRADVWADHFRWDRSLLVGLTPVGKVTIAVLAINHPTAVAVREELMAEGVPDVKRAEIYDGPVSHAASRGRTKRRRAGMYAVPIPFGTAFAHS